MAQEHEHFRTFSKDGVVRYEAERSGWIERQCDLLDCPWFAPMLRRMASGETVHFDEIREAYRTHSGGLSIPVGTWDQIARVFDEQCLILWKERQDRDHAS